MAPPKKASKLIQEIDKNFASSKTKQRCRWLDAFAPQLALRGLAWPTEARKSKSFRRFPDRAAPELSEGLQFLSFCPAGVFLSFFTDSSDISVRFSLEGQGSMPHMPTTGSSSVELYCREGHQWLPVATAIPSSAIATDLEQSLLEDISKERREYRLYLPLYAKLKKVAVGISPRAKVAPSAAPRGNRPLFFYGTSITQGGCANTAGSDMISILGRILDTEIINFGFSGCGLGEPTVARLIREIDAEMFVLDYAANTTPALLRETLPEFLRLLRERRPTTSVVLLGNVAFNGVLLNRGVRDDLAAKRDIIMDFYLQTKKQGDVNIHFIDGNGILPPNLGGAYVDGVHPTSHGFAIMAERLVPHLNVVRTHKRVGKA